SDDYPSGDGDGAGQLTAGGRQWSFQHVQVGNPQCAIRIDGVGQLEALDLPAIGPDIERHQLFPNRTNVSWYTPLAPSRIRVRIFERGVGETSASGTGATGAAVAHRVSASRAAGIDVISLGIGDPDTPTYPPIVAAAQRAVADPSTHTYPSNRGRPEFCQAVAAFYERRFGVTLDPETEVMAAIGAKECIFNLSLAFLDPGDVALASDPGYPVYTGGPLMAGGQPALLGLVPEL